ncbi:MAG: hypothetical protein ACJ762_10155 [Solirubrobacteraceae bacterium]
MNPDFPPDSAPLQVDRVEWVPASSEVVHVHLLGRWVDRPVSEPLVLLVGTERRRHAFDALPAPPAGVLAAFAVPNELRARLEVDIALQIGAHELPLPGAGTGTVREEGVLPVEEDAEAEVIDRAVLAERRARRAEMAEEGLVRRAADAEQTVTTLEAQLANLEERLGQAHEERDELQAGLADAERRLKAAQQREYAEQQGRIEAQDSVEQAKRDSEHEVTDLRRRLEAANQRAEDMAREVDRARRGIAEALQRSEADRAALRRAEEQLALRSERVLAGEASMDHREELERSLAEVSGLASELRDALATEQDARMRAEAALGAEREEAAAKVTLLEHELESRAAVQARIAGQLTELRSELDAVRAEADESHGTAATVAHLSEMADRLKDRVVALERRKDAAEAELARTQEILSARTAELERARIDLQRATRDVEVVRAESERHRIALEQSNRTIEAVRTSAGELQLRLDDERRERAQAEALLHEQLSRAQAEGRQSAVELEVELRGALERERAAFAAQVATFEQHVAGLREQVVVAAAELRDALDGERAARQAAERELAEERARSGSERSAASDALAQLSIERARRQELEIQVAEALSAVRSVQADDEAREARDAAVQRLVGEVLGTAASLRAAFEEESRKLEGELTAKVVEERARMADELEAMESRAGDLQTQMSGAGEELEAELAAERQARWLAEAEVARLRQQAGTGGSSLADKARMEHELTTLRAELDRTRRTADEHAAASGEARAIIADLTSASERLRAETPPVVDEEPLEATDRAEVRIPHPEPISTPEPTPAEPEPTIADATPSPPVVEPAPEAAQDPAPAETVPDATPLTPRLISAAERPTAPWLAPAIERLAAKDPAAAAKLVVGLLPVQRLMVSNDATYDLTVTELGTFRVLLHAGATTVEPRAEPGPRKEIDFHLEGPASALAELAAGGARRRPKGTHFEGSRRKLKRLLKDLRDPIHLPDVARSGAVIEPGLVLSALAAGMDPAWADGHTFTVAWDVTGSRGGTWTVRIGEGDPAVEPGLPEGGPTAAVHVSQAAFLPLLAGFAPSPGEQATVTGNTHAVALLRQWFDHAQGLQ